jgi:hypothetical protein
MTSPSAVQGGEADARRQIELTYAWEWFHHHVQQRLMAFNFFLIIVGVVSVAYAHAIDAGLEAVGVVVGVFGALVSGGFLMLDVRNQELVDCGSAALRRLEADLGVQPACDGRRRTHLATTGWIGSLAARTQHGRSWVTHARWLRSIEGIVGAMFVAATVWAATGFAGA